MISDVQSLGVLTVFFFRIFENISFCTHFICAHIFHRSSPSVSERAISELCPPHNYLCELCLSRSLTLSHTLSGIIFITASVRMSMRSFSDTVDSNFSLPCNMTRWSRAKLQSQPIQLRHLLFTQKRSVLFYNKANGRRKKSYNLIYGTLWVWVIHTRIHKLNWRSFEVYKDDKGWRMHIAYVGNSFPRAESSNKNSYCSHAKLRTPLLNVSIIYIESIMLYFLWETASIPLPWKYQTSHSVHFAHLQLNLMFRLSYLFSLLPSFFLDMSDTERDNAPLAQQPPPTSASNADSHQQAINYSSLAATAAVVAASGVKTSGPGQDQNLSSTETLLRNIQSLLTVAADNARQQERQITYEKGRRNIFFLVITSK